MKNTTLRTTAAFATMCTVMVGLAGLAGTASADELTNQWTLDGHADDHVGGAHGTWVGDDCYSDGLRPCLDLSACFVGDNFITTPLALQIGADESVTMSVWATMPNEIPLEQMEIYGLERSVHQEIRLYIATNGYMIASFRDDTSNPNKAIFEGPDFDGEPHHIAVVRNKVNETIDLYYDGILEVEGDDDGGDINVSGTRTLDIGALNHSTHGHINQFTGSIDEFRIYDYALTADDIWALANPCPPYELELFDPLPGVAGEPSSFQVADATFGMNVKLMYSLKSGTDTANGCPGLSLQLQNAKTVDTVVANYWGDAWITVLIPRSVKGTAVHFQAYERGSCKLSNPIEYSFK